MLRKYNFVRTPGEQQERLLNNAPESVDSGSSYSKNVKRALTASLQLENRTRNLQLSFRSGAKANLDLLLCGNVLKINDLWLDFEASHKKSPCCLSRTTGHETDNADCFSCHHIILRLYELILEELARHTETRRLSIESDGSLSQRVRETLSQMPIMIKAVPGDLPCSVDVSWADLDLIAKLHGLQPRCSVVLHRESSCSGAKSDLIRRGMYSATQLLPFRKRSDWTIDDLDQTALEMDGSISDAECTAPCGCPQEVGLSDNGGIVFGDLDPNELYFPMVARADAQAFYGLPPTAVRPSTAFSRSQLRLSLSPGTQGVLGEDPPTPVTELTSQESSAQTSPSTEPATPEFTALSSDWAENSFGQTSFNPRSPTLTEPRTNDWVDKGVGTPPRSSGQCVHQVENDGLRERLSEADQDLKTSKVEIEQLQREYANVNEELKMSNSDLLAAREQLTEKDQILEHQKVENDGLRSQVTAKTLDIKDISVKLNASQQRLTAADQMLKRFETEREGLRGQLATKTEETRAATLEVHTIRQKLGTEVDFREALEEEVARLQVSTGRSLSACQKNVNS